MGKTFKFLRFIDLLVTPYDFNVSNNEKSMTVTGGCLSLLVLLLMIVYTANYYVKLTTASSSIYTGTGAQDFETIELNQQSIAFALELTKTKGDIISYMEGLDQYFTISATLIEQTREQGVYGYNRVNTQLTASRCSQQYIEQFNFKSVSFTQQQLDNFICFDGVYYLDGQFYDPKFAYIKLDIVKCAGDNCKSEQEIYDFLDGGVDVDLFIKDTNIKSKYDSSNPAEIFPTNIFWRLTTSVGNNEDIFISPVTIDQVFNKDIPFDGSTVNNRLYTSSKVTKQERRQMSFDLQTVTSMCTFYLRTANSSNNYFVNDTSTLALVLSSISEGAGLALAVISVLKILYKFYCEHKTFEIIMNYVFKFDLNEKKDVNSTNGKSLIDKNVRINKLFGQKINYSFFSFIRFSIKNLFKKIKCLQKCCNQYDKEIILAQLAKTKIQSDLDLAQIVRKLYEIDFIKLFLFDDDQLKLFNTFCQPIFEKTMIQSKDNYKMLVQQPQADASPQDFKRTLSKMGAQQAFESKIPIETRLASISRFFKSQTKINSGQRLFEIYGKVKDDNNDNAQLNEKFLKFLKNNNKTLYSLIEFHDRQSKQLSQEDIIRLQKINKKQTYVNQDPIVEDEDEDMENEIDSEMKKSDERNNVILVELDSHKVPSEEEHQIINGYLYSGSQNQNDKHCDKQ